MPAPDAINQLVELFREHIDAYKRGNYNETQLRREFLDPFFSELGWDVFNASGYAGDYKDVVHEAALKIGGTTNAPDYSFRIGGQRKFFVEAKKPSVDVKGDPGSAYQLRRYGWTAGLPLSILTDFEEFAVYDCRIKPNPKDKASTARILYITYDQYHNHWDQIAGIFSKEAILKGAFDKYASHKTRRAGTAEVDDEFLKEMERWRTELARHLARHNDISARQLNHAVQLTIDRIVFLRICEDRGIEPAGSLQELLTGDHVYQRLFERFRHADAKYNSGLFHFEQENGRDDPDILTPNLEVSDKVLKDIIRNLYYPDAPYEFSVLPADILGHVYERFLGSVITLSSTGKTAKVEPKPELRKSDGVYYTPTYIVAYIVENTLGQLLRNRTLQLQGRGKLRGPVIDKPLRILDPACGSGSFLLGAYQHLLNWYLKFYIENDPQSWAKLSSPPIARRAIPGEIATLQDYKLTIQEKKRILIHHIFGVDIDAQAVEVTKLSLLLKVLESENEETLQPMLFAKERALPDLSNNIKCGNSLVGSDFYHDKQYNMFNSEELYNINAFDWQSEFRQIMDGGGFNAVIGNPPYVNIRILNQVSSQGVMDYLSRTYECAYQGYDLYVLFVERAHKLLCEGGLFGMIMPNKVGTLDYALNCRRLLLNETTIHFIADVSGLSVFPGVGVYPYIIVWEKLPPSQGHTIRVIHAQALGDLLGPLGEEHMQHDFDPVNGLTIHGTMPVEDRVVCISLSDCAQIETGTTGFSAYAVKDQLVEANESVIDTHFEFVVSGNIDPYLLRMGNVRYMKQKFDRPMISRQSDVFTARKAQMFSRPKLVVAGMTKRLEVAFDPGGTALGVQVYAITDMTISHLYVLALLNSQLLSHLFRTRFKAKHLAGGYLAINKSQLAKLPIRVINFDDPEDTSYHDRIVELAQSMLDMKNQLYGTHSHKLTPQEKRVIQTRIVGADREIDQLVYQLYRLNEDEILIVEASTA